MTGYDFSPLHTVSMSLTDHAMIARMSLVGAFYWEFGPLGCIAICIGFILLAVSRSYDAQSLPLSLRAAAGSLCYALQY